MFSSCLKYSSVFLSLWPHSPWPSLAADGHTGCVSFLNGPFCFSLSNTLKQYSHLFNVVYFDSPVHDETQCFMLSHLKICHMYNITLHRSTIYWTKMGFFVVLLHPLSPTIVTFNIKWHGHHHILHCLPWDALLGVAATFSCCLFVGLSASSFVLSTWKASSVGMRSGPWLGHWKIS